MKRILFLSLMLMMSLMTWAKDVSFIIKSPGSIGLGQQFRVEYILNSDGKDFRTDDFVGFDVLMGPSTSSSMSTSIINGTVTSETTKTFSFILKASQEGKLTLPGARVKVNGRQYSVAAKAITILPKGEQTQPSENSQALGLGQGDLLARLLLSKTTVYEGEALTVTFKMLTLNPQVQMQNVELPVFEGFTVQEVELPKQKSFELEHYDGKNYYAVDIAQYVLFPQRSGKLKIKGATLDMLVPVRSRRPSRDIFDEFFQDYQQISKRVVSGSPTVTVLPLPAGKPLPFSGGVGQFRVESNVSTTQVKANEALTFTLLIKGTGNIKYVKDPVVNFPADFEVYDPASDIQVKVSPSSVTGTKTIEYTVIPRSAGEFEIPAVSFSYYDPKTKKYQTSTTDPHVITVAKGKQSGASGNASDANVTVYQGVDKEDVKVLATDIRYIDNVQVADLEKEQRFWFGSLSYVLSYLAIVICFIVFFLIYRKRIKENANVALLRNKKANKVAIKRLQAAAVYLKTHQKEPYYEEMLKAMWGYLGDKLMIETSDLTQEYVREQLTQRAVKEEHIELFIRIVSDCEFARYAPVKDDQVMDNLYADALKAIEGIEDTINK